MEPRRTGISLSHILAVTLLLHSASSAIAAHPTPTERLGACTPQMGHREELFPNSKGLRVVVVRFVGQDGPSEKMGADLAYSLSQELPTYIRRSLQGDAQAAGLAEEDVQVSYIPCLMSSHTQAREVGKAWDADLVFWGQASCSVNNPQSCKLAPVVDKEAQFSVKVEGHVEAKRGNVQIGFNDNRKVTLALPVSTGKFRTSVTLVHWRGLQERSDQAVRIDPASVLDLDFPRLASERPLSLFRWAVGVYAFFSQRYALAAARFEESAAELYSGAEERSQLYRVMGTSYLYAGRPMLGLAAMEQARASCTSGDERCLGTALQNLGWASARIGEKAKALSFYEQALPLLRRVADRSGESTALNNLGAVYNAQGESAKALSFYEQALALSKMIGDRLGEATTLNNLGAAYDTSGEKAKALSFYEQALPLLVQTGDRAGEATTLNNLGALYFVLGEKAKALSFYEQALVLRTLIGDRFGEMTTLNNLGAAHDALGDYEKALGFYGKSLLLSRKTGSAQSEASTLMNIGSIHDSLGHRDSAIDYYSQALPLLTQERDRVGLARAFSRIGVIYDNIGAKTDALSAYKKALPFLRAIGDRSGTASVLNNIGAVYDALGDKVEALSHYEQALVLLKQVGDYAGASRTLNNISGVYEALGDKAKAVSR